MVTEDTRDGRKEPWAGRWVGCDGAWAEQCWSTMELTSWMAAMGVDGWFGKEIGGNREIWVMANWLRY